MPFDEGALRTSQGSVTKVNRRKRGDGCHENPRKFPLTALPRVLSSPPSLCGKIAQLVEQLTENQRVPGSIPGLATTSAHGASPRLGATNANSEAAQMRDSHRGGLLSYPPPPPGIAGEALPDTGQRPAVEPPAPTYAFGRMRSRSKPVALHTLRNRGGSISYPFVTSRNRGFAHGSRATRPA